MAISDRSFAAEIVQLNGRVAKFDDIGCMLRYALRENLRPSAAVAFYVMDFQTQRWLPATEAVYLRSEQLHSPMASGLAAFATPEAADKLAQEFPGQIYQFQQLWEVIETLDRRQPHVGTNEIPGAR